MKQNKLYNTAIYCRLSLDDGNEGDSSSIKIQKMMLEKYALEHGFTIYDYYIDDGYSGLNFERPAFKRLMQDISEGKINLVLTKDLSRLGRNHIQTSYFIEIFFPDNDIRYIAVNDNVDTLYDNNDIAPFKNILNDMYAKDTSRKVKTAKRLLMQKGMFMAAQPPYGYKKDPNDKNHLVIDEEAAEVVRLIFDLALSNIGVVKITRELNKRGIMPPSIYKASKGDLRFTKLTETRRQMFKNYDIESWNTVTVGAIIRDMVYVGDMENHKYEVKNYKTKKCTKVPKEEHIIVRNTHEPIISRSDFEHVQELIRHRQRPSRHNHPNLFKGILRCKNCGRPLNLYYNKRRSGKMVWRYRCVGNFVKYGLDDEPNTIGYLEIYDIVKSKLKELMKSLKLNNDEFINNIVNKVDTDEHIKELVSEKNKIVTRLNTIDSIIIRLYEDLVEEKLSGSNYQKMLDKYQDEQKKLNSQLIEIESKLTQENKTEENIETFKQIARKYIDFDELTPEIINNLISHITVSHVKVINGTKFREIKIIYKFIG